MLSELTDIVDSIIARKFIRDNLHLYHMGI